MIRPLMFLLAIGACSQVPSYQTTSGANFIDAARGQIDPDVAAVAAIEPALQFPARIGIARVVNGRLTLPTEAETALFTQTTQNTSRYGSFVVVNPYLTELLTTARLPVDQNGRAQHIRNVHRQIQLTAARQHLDYVMIYEVGARSPHARTPHGLGNVPGTVSTPDARVTGIARAVFMDVRTGYPYSVLHAERDISDLRRDFGIRNDSEASRQAAVLKVTEALAPQIATMMAELAVRAN